MKKITILLLLFSLAGCASTNLTSYVDPEFRNKTYNSFVIEYLSNDLQRKSFIEKRVAEILFTKGIRTHIGIDVFPPTRKLSNEEIGRIIHRTGAEGYLLIAMTNAYSVQTYVPPTYNTSGSAYSYGNYTNVSATTTQTGGYTVNKPVQEFKIELIDVSTSKTAYQATGQTRGGGGVTDEIMADSLANALVEKLIEDRIVIPIMQKK